MNIVIIQLQNSSDSTDSPLIPLGQVHLCSLSFQISPTNTGRETDRHTSNDQKLKLIMCFITSHPSCFLIGHMSKLFLSNHLQTTQFVHVCVCGYTVQYVNLGVLTVGPALPFGPSGPSSPCRDTVQFIIHRNTQTRKYSWRNKLHCATPLTCCLNLKH